MTCSKAQVEVKTFLLFIIFLFLFVFQIVTAAPQKFKIDILPVDDGTPRIVTNLGLQWLEYMDNKVQIFLLQGHTFINIL